MEFGPKSAQGNASVLPSVSMPVIDNGSVTTNPFADVRGSVNPRAGDAIFSINAVATEDVNAGLVRAANSSFEIMIPAVLPYFEQTVTITDKTLDADDKQVYFKPTGVTNAVSPNYATGGVFVCDNGGNGSIEIALTGGNKIFVYDDANAADHIPLHVDQSGSQSQGYIKAAETIPETAFIPLFLGGFLSVNSDGSANPDLYVDVSGEALVFERTTGSGDLDHLINNSNDVEKYDNTASLAQFEVYIDTSEPDSANLFHRVSFLPLDLYCQVSTSIGPRYVRVQPDLTSSKGVKLYMNPDGNGAYQFEADFSGGGNHQFETSPDRLTYTT